MSLSRREFLRLSCCSAAAAAFMSRVPNFGLMNAHVIAASDYKALVCIFLYGGNDGNNLIVPLDSQEYANYARLRRGLAIPQGSLLPVQPLSYKTAYGLHPQLRFQELWSARKVAIVANCGLLVQPTSRTQFVDNSVPLPVNLYSHVDQQNQSQGLQPSAATRTGWAGRIADGLQTLNSGQGFPAITSTGGTSILCQGFHTRPATVTPGYASGFTNLSGDSSAEARALAMQQLLSFDSGVVLVQAAKDIYKQAFSDSKILAGALANSIPFATSFPTTVLGQQLLQVARIIQARAALGLSRQIFFCALGNFDTHSNQLDQQSDLVGQLSTALVAFHAAMGEMGVEESVTTFTLTEFGRSLQMNSGLGSDHGWGNHHVVIGGAVKGGDIYGKMPVLDFAGPDDASDDGRWIPSTSLDQYGSTLASWFGVSDVDLPSIFPNLKNFPATTVGFMQKPT